MVDKPKPAGRSQQQRRAKPATKDTRHNPLQKPWLKQAPSVKSTATDKKGSKTARAPAFTEESKVYGENACRVLFGQRPEAIIRLYISQQLAPKFSDVMKYLAGAKKAYHIVDDAELEKVAASQHHGGLVLLVKRKPIASIASYLSKTSARKDCLLALDGVGNPHKIGNTNSVFF